MRNSFSPAVINGSQICVCGGGVGWESSMEERDGDCMDKLTWTNLGS